MLITSQQDISNLILLQWLFVHNNTNSMMYINLPIEYTTTNWIILKQMLFTTSSTQTVAEKDVFVGKADTKQINTFQQSAHNYNYITLGY